MALSRTWRSWFIFEMVCEKGEPLSRLKANSSREVVARAVILPLWMRRQRIIVKVIRS
jgi:hypothetical protein